MKKFQIVLLSLILLCFLFQSGLGSVLADDETSTLATSAVDTNLTPQPPALQHVTFTIRDGSTTVFSGSLVLPDISAADILVLPTTSTDGISVSPRTVLGVLESLQASSTNFQISDLSYSKSYSSFLINCIAVPPDAKTPDCYNWTDAVNGSYPTVGVDHQMLNDGDVVYLFFGQPHQTVLSTSTVAVGEPFTATAEQYDLSLGDYKPFSGATLGVGTLNKDFTFTELATSTADTNGQAVFTLKTPGKFSAGIKENFYFPTVDINVVATATITTSTPVDNSPPVVIGSSGGGGGITHTAFNIQNALTFISNNQNPDGSFEDFSTDWVALALASNAPTDVITAKLHSYLLNARPVLSPITDYERHAMALEALGINPYSGTSVNYISPIEDALKIGIPVDNGNIFALIALKPAGFTSNDSVVQNAVAYLLKSQLPDGSFSGTPDMTAAAIQAIGQFSNIPGTATAIQRAAAYLKSSQKQDGGFGNIDSTSWAQTGINWLIASRCPNFESESAWTSSIGLFPTDALANGQQPDGGTDAAQNRVWSTSYAALAASGKSWPAMLTSFPKQISLSAGTNNAGAVLEASTTASSTLPALEATTTPISQATTSPKIVTITNPALTMPIIAPEILPSPKPKFKKPQAQKPQATVLGEATAKPTPPTSPEKITTDDNTDKPGLLGRIWNSIASFFRNLF